MFANTLERRIEWGDCDPAGIVFNPNYFSFFDHSTAMLYEAAGFPKPKLVKDYNGVGFPLVETKAVFKAPCSNGDDVSITSTVTDVRGSSFDVHHQLFKNDRLCVEGFETRVWTIRDGETGRIKSAPLPPPLAAKFRDGN